MSVPRLQELYAQALARRSDAAEGCVPPEELLALVRKQGDEARRLQTLDHVMGCAACHREFELLRALEAAGGGSREPATVRSISRRIMPLALAASVLLAIGVGIVMRNRESDTTRGGGSALVLLTPAAEVAPAEPVTFSWRPFAGDSALPFGAVGSERGRSVLPTHPRHQPDPAGRDPATGLELSLVGTRCDAGFPCRFFPAGPPDSQQVEQHQSG